MIRRTPTITLAAFFCIAVAGCEQPTPGNPDAADRPLAGGPASGAVVEAAWPYWPMRMRIHPLTMVADDPDTGEPVIEARVEMLDRFGDTTKCVGQFRFELHDGRPASESAPAVRQWNVDVREPERNRIHFDTVTRTYLFRLSLSGLETAVDEPHLRVFVLSVNGRRFIDTVELR